MAARYLSILLLSLLIPSLIARAEETPLQPDSASEMVAVENVVGDQSIVSRLESIFGTRPRYDQLEVRVESGVVTLEGNVDSSEAADWAKSLAERTEGVVLVDNRLDVLQQIDIQSNLAIIQTSLGRLWADLMRHTPLLVAGCIVLILTATFAKLVGWAIMQLLSKRSRMRSSLKDLIYQLATIATWIIGLLVSAVVVFPGMTPARALTFLGAGSVAVGFAFKDIFENFFAGVLILWRYPFDRGDFISSGDLTGRVEEITIRNTLIRRLDGELAVVPNAHLFKNAVDVLTNRTTRRVQILVGVAYDEDLDGARDVICHATRGCSTVESNRAVEVFAHEFADSSINFEVSWWTGAQPAQVRRSRDEVVAAIKRALDGAGIEIPFPYRTLTFKGLSSLNLTESLASQNS